MKSLKLHRWNISVKEALDIQNKLSKCVIQQKLDKPVKVLAGCDVAFEKNSYLACAGIVLMSFPELDLIDEKVIFSTVKFPYIPGFLSFRETPALLEIFKTIKAKIDLIFVDGYGIAHPRKFGIASHLGLILDLPTIGCGKTYLIGEYDEPKVDAGDYSWLFYKDEIVGAVVRTKTKVKPIFVSVGHKICLNDAIEFTLKCCKGYRIPEPIRMAHIIVNRNLKEKKLKSVAGK